MTSSGDEPGTAANPGPADQSDALVETLVDRMPIGDVTTDTTQGAQGNEELRRRDEILSVVRLGAERFLAGKASWQDNTTELLAQLGRAARVSRVQMFENYTSPEGEQCARRRYEWIEPGVRRLLDSPAVKPLEYAALGWNRCAEVLQRGDVLHGGTHGLPSEQRPELEASGALSLALVPIFVDGSWWGFIRFDDCTTDRKWTTTQIEGLRAAASTLGAALQRELAESELRDWERQYRRVFDATGDGLVISDLEGRLVEANPAFCRMHGYTLEELVGRPATTFIHPEFHALRRVYADTIARGGQFQTQSRNVRKDGTSFPVEVHGVPFTWHGRPHTLGVVRDDTERTAAFAKLEHRIAALARVAASLTVDRDLETTLETLAGAVVDAGPAVACSIQLINPHTDDLQTIACRGLPDGYVQALFDSWRAGVDSPTRGALEQQRLVIVHDARRLGLENPDYAPLHPLLAQVQWNSIVVVPFDALGRSVGALNAYYRAEDDIGDDEVAFLQAVAHQGAVVAENTRLLSEAQSKAGLEERQRLARELHDSVSQALYGIALGARTARTLAERDPLALTEPLDYVLNLADAALAEMRSLIFELRPESLATEGLVAALERQVTALRARYDATVHTELGAEPDLPFEVKEALYRIAQEALHNTVKHARADNIHLTLRRDGEATLLEVTDDGVGFDPTADHPGHLGLHTMRERAIAARGTIDVQSRPGAGSTIRVRLQS